MKNGPYARLQAAMVVAVLIGACCPRGAGRLDIACSCGPDGLWATVTNKTGRPVWVYTQRNIPFVTVDASKHAVMSLAMIGTCTLTTSIPDLPSSFELKSGASFQFGLAPSGLTRRCVEGTFDGRSVWPIDSAECVVGWAHAPLYNSLPGWARRVSEPDELQCTILDDPDPPEADWVLAALAWQNLERATCGCAK